MDSTMVQRFLYLGRHIHEIVVPRGRDMHRGNNLGLGQLPNVEVVQVKDAPDLKNRFTNFPEGNVGRDTLEEDVCSASD